MKKKSQYAAHFVHRHSSSAMSGFTLDFPSALSIFNSFPSVRQTDIVQIIKKTNDSVGVVTNNVMHGEGGQVFSC